MAKTKKIKKGASKDVKGEATLSLQVLSRKDLLTAFVLSTLTLMVYAFTAAPGVALADAGDFLNGVLTLGIVHPPGYPLYTVLGHLFSLLPFGESAYRVNLFSALWGSLCLGVVFLILRILSIERIHAVFASLFLGFTTVFWSKTGVAEVYSFNGFLIACIVLGILSYNRDKKKNQLYLVFLTTGLALSNHYPLVILSGLGLVFLLDRNDLRTGDFFKGLLFLGLGLTPYLYLFIQASNPELQYSFGKPSTFGMVLDHIARKHYAIDYGGTVWDKFPLAFTFLKAIFTNFLFAGVFLVCGITFSFLDRWPYRYPFLIAALGPSLGVIALLTFPNEAQYRGMMAEYWLPSFLFLSVFLAFGLKTLMNRYIRQKWLHLPIFLAILVFQMALNFSGASHHNDRLADIWGRELLNSLPRNAKLIFCGQGTFPLYYLQLIENVRPDVKMYDRNSFWTRDNLYAPELLFKRKRIDVMEVRKQREREINSTSDGPVFYSCKFPLDDLKADFSFTPFLFRADKGHREASVDYANYKVSDSLLESLGNGYPKTDYWTTIHREMIFHRLLSFYGGNQRPEVEKILASLRKSKFYSDPDFLLSAANNLYYYQNYALARKLYLRAEEVNLGSLSPTNLAVFCDVLAKAKNYEKALEICIRQEQSSPSCAANTVKTRETIAEIYTEQGNWPEIAKYSRKILECQPHNEIAQRYLMMAKDRAN